MQEGHAAQAVRCLTFLHGSSAVAVVDRKVDDNGVAVAKCHRISLCSDESSHVRQPLDSLAQLPSAEIQSELCAKGDQVMVSFPDCVIP